MVRTYWLVPVFYEASGNLDLQPSARIDHVEACRPRAYVRFDSRAEVAPDRRFPAGVGRSDRGAALQVFD